MFMPSIFGERFLDDHFFDDFNSNRFFRTPAPAAGLMKTDIREKDNSFELDIDLPGFKKEDIKAELKDGYLTINAETKSEDEDKDEKGTYIRKERYYGSCSRSFYVGEEVTQEDIKAKFENGILQLSIPKKEEQPKLDKPSYIAIEG